MSVTWIITILIYLGSMIFMSFKSSRPRTNRRWGLAIVFLLLLETGFLLVKNVDIDTSEDILATTKRDSNEGIAATCYMASEIDFSNYSAVGCIESTVSNYMVAGKKSYPIENIFDGDKDTCWQDGVDGNGEGTEITATLAESSNIQYLVIHNGRSVSQSKYEKNGRVRELEIGTDQFTTVVEIPDVNGLIAIKLDGWGEISSFRFKIISVYPGSKYSDTCISEIGFYK